MNGFSYGRNKKDMTEIERLEKKCIEEKEWAGIKVSFMMDFYLRQGLKGKTPEEIVEFLEYGFSVYQGINRTSDRDLYKLARMIENQFSVLADVLGIAEDAKTDPC